MGVLRRYNKYQGLKDLDVLINDDAPISQYFNAVEVPDIITQGRSSFLVGGSPLLKPNVELKFEIINDETGKVIYTEPVPNYLEGTSRRVSIEVYDDPDTFGDATMYVVGELNPNEVEVPSEWLDVYNVRWYSKIYISGTGVNTEPIFFYNQPSMWVGEIIKGFVKTTYPTGSVTQSTGTVSGEPLTGTEGSTPGEEDPGDFVEQLQKSFKSKVYGGGGKNAGVSRRGRRARRSSPEVETFTINLEGSTTDVRHVGATFTVNSPKAASSFVTESYHEFPEKFETTIKNVKNDSTLVPSKEFVIKDTRYPDDDPRQKVIAPLDQTAYTMSFQPAPTHSVSEVNFRSFADVRISKMRTFSGDVYRVKLYSKNKDAFGDFELIADTPIESPELLYDVFSPAGSRRMGYFVDQDTLDSYWESTSNTTASLNSTYILDSVYLSGSNQQEKEILRFQGTGSRPIEFDKDIEYSIKANIIGKIGPTIRNGVTSSFAELGIFLSGSSFANNNNYGSSFGHQITPPGESEPGLLTIDTSDGVNIVDFGTVEEVFKPLYNGEGVLQFGIPAGSWYISDVSIAPIADTGFSPDWIRIVAPVPPLSQERPDDYEFIAEFYDVNNNIADTVTHVSASTFQGANTIILGDDNLFSGSIFIGNALYSGIEMAGVSSAFVRSMGYLGFSSASNAQGTNSGFLMWSGSVLPDSGDNYAGVGLELVGDSGSYLRFRTKPSELDIRANAFFVGNPTSQFISGSGGNIEISSSNFHVQPDGDVTMTGTITADAGNIGDWKIVDGKLSGSNATLDAVGAALYHTTLGPGSDTSAAFDQLRNEYYIDFTPSEGPTATAGKYYVKFGPNFSVSQSGVLFASGAVFEGTITASAGSIGGASIESSSLSYSPYWRISSSADTSDPASFISSSAFKVSAGGNITGSQVLFSGGKIGGWDISEGYISKALSGSVAHQAYTRVYLSATTDNQQNIQEGLHVYRKDEDVEDGEVKIVRVGGLSDTTDLHANNDYGIQVIQKDSDENYSNIMYIGESTQTISGFSINPVAIHSSNKNLILSGSGEITGSKVLFDGGKIGGFDIVGSSATVVDAISSADKSLILSGSGQVTGSQVLFTGGKIGGWDLSSTRIQSPGNTMRLTSTNPKITMGTHTFEDGPGIQLGFNSGKVEFYAGDADIEDAGTNYLKFHEDTGVDIQTAVFKLTTSTMVVNSGVNSGKISLGTTPNTSVAGTNTGFYVDGTGDFLVRGDANNYMKMYGTGLQIKTEEFELDAGNIEISSTNASMSLGEGNIILRGASSTIDVGSTSNKQVQIVGASDKGYIATGKTSATSTTAGFWLANNNTDPEFHVGNATDFIKFDGGDLDIQSQKLEISASTLQVSTTQASMSLGHNASYPQGKLIMEGSGTPTFKMGPDVSFISMTTGSGVYMDGDGNFRFGDDDGGITFENGSFAITGSDLDISVTDLNIAATGFQLSSQEASMSLGTNRAILMQGGTANPYISIGQHGGTIGYNEPGLLLAYIGTDPVVSFVGSSGHFKFNGSSVDIDTNTFELDANDGDLQISSTHKSMSLNDQTILMDGANAKIVIGSANKVTIQGGTTDNYMVMGSKTSFTHFDQSTQGIIIGMDSAVPKLEMVGSATNYISYDGTNFDIKLSEGLELDATNIELSSTQASMSLGEGKIVLQGASSPFMAINSGSTNQILVKTDGTDAFMTMGSKTSFAHEGSSYAGILIGMDSTNPQAEFVKDSGNYFIFDGGSGVDIKTTDFELDANTGDLQLSSLHKSMSLGDGKIILQGAATPYVQVGSSNSITLKTDGTDSYMVMGSKTSFTHYDKSTVGIILGMDTAVPKFEMAKSSDEYLRWDSTDGLDLRTKKMEVSASNLEISSLHASMSIGDPNSSGGAIVLHADGTDKMLKFGDKTTFDQTGTAGLIMGMDGTDPEFDYTVGTGNNQYIRMLPAGISIKTPSFNLDTDRLDISSDDSRIDVYDASGGVDGSDLRVRIGEVDPTTANHYGLVIYDGTGSGSADELVHFSDVRNQIASWSLSPTQISSENLILDSGGTIQTSDFASGLKGWRITSANNGEAEFEKVTVRGTLATTVFEKESVNAVGGQLYIANSTIYTGSAQLASTAETMSVANVGGFTSGEIISAKKISETGFQTEYMYIESASRNIPSSDKDLSGNLYLIRGYSGSFETDSGSVGDSPSSAQTYENGQVIVSTGKIGTGFVRINANPNDSTTPYIDIVERTGSAIYDVELKARLGDLSGLSSGLLYGNSSPGFGLFTENVFLQGAITATTGSFTGIVWIETDVNNKMALGTNVQSTNDGIYLNDNNYWYTNDKFRIGDTNYYLKWDSSNITIVPQTFELNAGSGDFQISSTHKSMSLGDGDIHFHSPTSTQSTMRIGSTTTKAIQITGSNALGVIRSGKSSVSDTTAGFWLANNNQKAEFHVGDTTDYIKFYESASTNAIEISTRAFELDANTGDLQLSSTQHSMSFADGTLKLGRASSGISYVSVGSTLGKDIQITGSATLGVIRSGKTSATDTTEGFWLANNDSDAEFHVGDTADYIRFNDNALAIETRTFELDAGDGDVQISSGQASMSLGGQRIVLQGDSNPFIAINSGSANDIKLKTDGTDAYMVMGNKEDFGDEGYASGNEGILIGMDSTNPQAEFVKSPSNYFIFDGGTGVDIKTTAFDLDAGPNELQLSSTEKSMSLGGGAIRLAVSASNHAYAHIGSTLGSGIQMTGSSYGGTIRSGKEDVDDTTSGFWLHNNAGTAQFHVGDSTDALKFDGSKFEVTSSHMDVSGQDVTFDIEKFELSATDLRMSTTHKSMSLGYNTSVAHGVTLVGGSTSRLGFGTKDSYRMQLVDNGSDSYLQVGTLAFGSETNTGILIGNDGGNFEMRVYKDSDEYFTFDGTDGLDIRSTKIYLSTGAGMTLSGLDSSDATNNYLALGAASGYWAGEGFWADGDGNFRVGTPDTAYVAYNASDNKFHIKTADINIDTAKLDMIASSSGEVRLSMGATPPTDFSSNGIILSGSGFFNFQRDANNYIRNTSDSFDIKAATFNLLAGNLQLSGSSAGAGLKLGSVVRATNGATEAGAGLSVDSAGNFLLRKDADNKISMEGGELVIKSEEFDLNAGGKLILNSSQPELQLIHANARIQLGASLNTSIAGTNKGVYMDGGGDFLLYGSATNYFKFDADGSSIDIKSDTFDLDATTIIMDSTLNHGTIRLGSSGGPANVSASTAGIYMDGSTEANFLAYGDANNYFKKAGTSIDINAETFDLQTTYLRVSSSAGGTIAMGATIPKSISGSGVFLSGSGDFLAGNHAGNKIQYASGPGAIVMKSNTFSLDATTIVIDSSANDGKIALGASPNSGVAGTNPGIYMDGTGDFLIYGDVDNYFRFDITDKLEIKAETFDLDADTLIMESDASSPYGKFQLGPSGGPGSATGTGNAGAYLDGTGKFNFVGDSDNYIRFNATGLEIQTPNLTASAAGAVTMAGTVTATAGAIGGWYITSNQISTVAPGGVAASSDFTINTSPYIAMGSTAPQTFGAGGIQMGTYGTQYGKFLVANLSDTAGHLKFDAETGDLHISSSTVLIGKSGSAVSGLQPAGAYVSMSAEGQMEISSSGFHFKPGGDAVLAGGNITFEKDGDITSNDYLIERSRLFGSGEDGTLTLSGNMTMTQDYYFENVTINDNVTLDTGGYRLYVRDTLTLVGSNSLIHNDGTGGSGYSGGAGGGEGTLVGGTLGANGGLAGAAGSTGAFDGGRGGGAGGGGGHVLIFARIIINNGRIRSNGGAGAQGQPASLNT